MNRLVSSAFRNGRVLIAPYPSAKVDTAKGRVLDKDGNNPGPSFLPRFGRGVDDVLGTPLNLHIPQFTISGFHLQQNLSNRVVVEELALKPRIDEPKRKSGFVLPRGKPATREESVQTCSELTPTPEEDARRRLESFPTDLENQVGAELLAAGLDKEAFERFQWASKNGSLAATHNLGLCYSKGRGIKKNAVKAFELWEYGSNLSDADCTYQVALCYIRGLGTSKDIPKGHRYMKKAAMQGSPEALYYRAMQQIRSKQWDELAHSLKLLLKNEEQRARVSGWLNKKGFPEDARPVVQEALAPYQTPFDIDGQHLQQKVVEERTSKPDEPKRKNGFILPRGKPTTHEMSVQTCSELAPTPEEDARQRLESIPRDLENQVGAELLAAGLDKEAFERFQSAAKKGNLSAMHNLGLCYSKGHGTKKNPVKAFEIWEYGSKFSDPDCTYQVALCYIRGLGTAKDVSKGQRYMNMAAVHGSPEALYYRAMQQIRSKQWDELTRSLKLLLKNEEQRARVSGWLNKKGFPEDARPVVQEALAPYQAPL